jgi:hypothetical protein
VDGSFASFLVGLSGLGAVQCGAIASIVRPASAPVSSGPLQDIKCSFEVVGDGGEVDLDGGFVDAAPSHPAQAVASFPGSEDLLNPPPHPVDELIPVFELAKCFLFVAAPHAGGDYARRPAFGTNSVSKVATPVGAVSKDLAGVIGQRIRASPAIVDVGGRNGNFFDQRRVGIGSDMSFEAMNCRLALVLDPARVVITLAGGRNDRCVDKRTGLDRDRLRFELRCHSREQQPIKIMGDQRLAKTDKRGPLGRCLRS